MKQSTEQKLQYWAESGNFSGHPVDDRCFFDFIIEAYKNGDSDILFDDFSKTVGDFLKDEEIMMKFYDKYDGGVKLLEYYDRKR